MQDLLLVPKHFHGVVERAGGYRGGGLFRLSRREFLLRANLLLQRLQVLI